MPEVKELFSCLRPITILINNLDSRKGDLLIKLTSDLQAIVPSNGIVPRDTAQGRTGYSHTPHHLANTFQQVYQTDGVLEHLLALSHRVPTLPNQVKRIRN